MISRILQFIKKIKLAISLARFDSLFVLKGLSDFRFVCFIAGFWRKPTQLTPLQCLNNFLRASGNPLYYGLLAIVESHQGHLLLPRTPFSRELSGNIIFKTALSSKDVVDLQRMVARLVKSDCLEYSPYLPYFNAYADSLLDMRIYGSNLAEFSPDLMIDWQKTDKPQLCLQISKGSFFTNKISVNVQKALVEQLATNFYQKSFFIADFSGVLCTSSQVSIVDFDSLYHVDTALRSYAQQYLEKNLIPQTVLSRKLHHLFLLLQFYCPDIDWRQHWLQYQSNPVEPIIQPSNKVISLFNNQGLNLVISQKLEDSNPEAFAYLLDKSRHLNDPRFKKSSILYFGPLIILIFVLLKFFS